MCIIYIYIYTYIESTEKIPVIHIIIYTVYIYIHAMNRYSICIYVEIAQLCIQTLHYITLQYFPFTFTVTLHYMHAYIHACMHASIHTYLHPTYIHTYLHYIHTYIPTYIHTYLHTYLPTYIHTYRYR